jgi:hypothetical protein
MHVLHRAQHVQVLRLADVMGLLRRTARTPLPPLQPLPQKKVLYVEHIH